jgi:hypothetical protein
MLESLGVPIGAVVESLCFISAFFGAVLHFPHLPICSQALE